MFQVPLGFNSIHFTIIVVSLRWIKQKAKLIDKVVVKAQSVIDFRDFKASQTGDNSHLLLQIVC